MIRGVCSLFLLFLVFQLKGQEETNLTKFTPAVIFAQGEWDIRSFTSIYSQTTVTNQNGNLLPLGYRSSILTTFLEFSIGLQSRLNIGGELHYNSSSIDPGNGSALRVLLQTEGVSYRNSFSYLGPKIKWQPVVSLPTLSIQSTFLFPIAQDLETPIFLNHDRYNWYTQVFYDHMFSSKFSVFADIGMLYRINRSSNTEGNLLRFPLGVFVNYFPLSIVNLYIFSQYSPRYGTLSNEQTSIYGLTSWFTQIGGGIKVQVSPKIGLEFSYAKIAWSRNEGAGSNINFGLRYIH